MNKKLYAVLLCWMTAAVVPVRAQWVTEKLHLKAGWNAVFLHVDASHATLDELVGASAPVLTPIEQVWRWNSNPSTVQFVQSPQQPLDSGTQWASWRRSTPGAVTLSRLTANAAYLVYTTADHVWELKGKPVAPDYRWSTTGLNFFGFPTEEPLGPTFENFLADVPSLQFSEIYRYPGGELGTANPARVFALRTSRVQRGTAYWIRAGEVFNNYFGPFDITAAAGGRVEFGNNIGSYSFRLRNRTRSALSVTLDLIPSESAPAGHPVVAGVPPLLVRGELDPNTLTHGLATFAVGDRPSWNLAPDGEVGSEVEVVLGLDRAAITNAPGQLLAGILRLTDSLGQTRIDLAVSGTASPSSGLWVGSAAVTHVGQYLQSYLRAADNSLVVQTNGSYVVTGVDTNLTAVPTPFPLRLIVHNPASGPATLMQRVYVGLNAATNVVVSSSESALAPALLGTARRLTATHLPWSESNVGWSLSGRLAQGVPVTTSVTNRFDGHESNPFLHTYHPDHDNLNSRFNAQLPAGSESFTIVRELTLVPSAPPNDFNSRISANQQFTGEYLETLRVVGLARAGGTNDTRRFDSKGVFQLNRISEVPTLTRTP
jgi:hypothetical protein